MAKISKKSLDGVSRAPVRQSSYEAPVFTHGSRPVPKEYQTFERASKRGGGLIWLVFFLFLASVAGFVFWTNRQAPEVKKSLELSVAGPNQLVSGDVATYTVRYKNLDKVPLEKVELGVRWPSGFYFDEATIKPSDSNATTWFLDDLPVGGSIEIKISGQLVGQKDENLSALFNLKYQPQNFHSDFKEKNEVTTKITDNKLELSIESFDKTLVSTPNEIKFHYKNISSEKLTDLNLNILYPQDLEITSVDPKKEGDYWVVSLESGEEKTITMKGSFIPESQSSQLLVGEIGNMVEGKFRRLARLEKSFSVLNPQFTINLQINGQTDNQSVDWGQVLRYQMEVTNDSGTDLTGVQVTALLDGAALDWSSLDTIGNRQESKIVWTQKENQDLAVWPTGQARTFTWQLKVGDNKISDRNIENIIQINLEGLADWQQVSSPVVLTVGKGLVFNNGVYWHLGGRRVGSGILPPKVGEETQYLAVWSLAEATGKFNNVVVQTNLPPGVSFVSETDVQAGELAWDETKRTLTWQIGDFNSQILPLTASFMITVNPSEDNRGSAMTLFNETSIAAKGDEDLFLRSKAIKTTDVVANSTEPIGIVQ
ncbi:MAG: hypothetical protein C3F02_04095 [Parcubacteria group bacterium]|nr:MAG: hypothetical protein C3F02_04095 [Parcubacteria group bacterium]